MPRPHSAHPAHRILVAAGTALLAATLAVATTQRERAGEPATGSTRQLVTSR